MKRLFIIISLLFVTQFAYSAPSNTMSLPNSFAPNTTIQSSEVNANNNEISSKYNAHSHTDLTQIGTITSGVWNGTAISTQYGGTGENFSATAQGSIIYFDGTGSMAVLAPGTSGTVLTSGGTGANPSFSTFGLGGRHGISRGFEASAATLKTTVTISGGTLLHNVTEINVATTTTLTIATAADYSSGSAVTYGGGAGWNYIGVKATDTLSQGYVKFLGNNPPTSSDTLGNTSGPLLYAWDGTLWWRVIGAIRVSTANKVAIDMIQHGNVISLGDSYTEGLVLNGGTATSFTDADCSSFMPKISQLGGFIVRAEAALNYTYLRPNGTSGSGARFDMVSGESLYARIPTDATQIIEYNNQAGAAETIYLQDYQLTIR